MTDAEEFPRALAIAWGMETSPSRGPKRELSHESIVDAAIEIASTEGLPGVTMQRVAQRFGFTTMALYRYVASKDDLFVLMLDRATATATEALIDDTDWRAGMRDWAEALRVMFHERPWLFELYANPMAGILRGVLPNMMRLIDNALRAMRTLELPLQDKVNAALRLSSLIAESAALELAKDAVRDGLSETTLDALREVATADRLPDLYPLIEDRSYFDTGGLYSEISVDTELDDFLDALERRASSGSVTPPVALGPAEALARAEQEWRTATALRKRATQRVNELAKVEGQRQAEFETAKAFAKAAAKSQRG